MTTEALQKYRQREAALNLLVRFGRASDDERRELAEMPVIVGEPPHVLVFVRPHTSSAAWCAAGQSFVDDEVAQRAERMRAFEEAQKSV